MPITTKARNLLDKINDKFSENDCSGISTIYDFRNKFGGPVKTSDGRKIDPKYVNFFRPMIMTNLKINGSNTIQNILKAYLRRLYVKYISKKTLVG